MGNRLSKIYTKTGDLGETGLGDGSRVSKTDLRVEAIGAVDELNSVIGLLVEELKTIENSELEDIVKFLRYSQHRIFDLGGELSIPGFEIINASHVTKIELNLDRLNSDLEPLKNFVLPGGSRVIATARLARATCRRAERRVIAIMGDPSCRGNSINSNAICYLNRFSDYLFVVARSCAKISGINEVLWEQG